jgi:hypothetical protein
LKPVDALRKGGYPMTMKKIVNDLAEMTITWKKAVKEYPIVVEV